MSHPGHRPNELLRNELTEQVRRTRGLLTGSPEEAAEAALARVSNSSAIEQRIVAELALATPLADPDHFPVAHRRVMRALEVLDRDGSRDPSLPGLGPLSGLAETTVEFVAEYLTQKFASDVIQDLRRLYARREAQCAGGSTERRSLARARVEAERLASGYSGGGSGLPALVAGGAAVPVLASLANTVGAIPFSGKLVVIAGGVLLIALFAVLSWVLLQGAAVARRRSRLIMEAPLTELWATIGGCGDVPRDDSTALAVVALLLTAAIWLGLPLLGILAVVLP